MEPFASSGRQDLNLRPSGPQPETALHDASRRVPCVPASPWLDALHALDDAVGTTVVPPDCIGRCIGHARAVVVSLRQGSGVSHGWPLTAMAWKVRMSHLQRPWRRVRCAAFLRVGRGDHHVNVLFPIPASGTEFDCGGLTYCGGAGSRGATLQRRPGFPDAFDPPGIGSAPCRARRRRGAFPTARA